MSALFGDWTRHSASTTPSFAEILLAILLTILLILALAHPAGGQTDYLFPDEVLTPRAEAVQLLPGPAVGPLTAP